MESHSSILPQRIPWSEEPGVLQSIGSQRVGHDCSDLACMLASKGGGSYLEVRVMELGLESLYPGYFVAMQMGNYGEMQSCGKDVDYW